MTQISSRLWKMVGVLTLLLGASGMATAEGIAWQTNYNQAHAAANHTGRPVFVMVSSRGCGWCRELDRTTFRDPHIIQRLNGTTIPLKIDANDRSHTQLVEALNVQGVPTLAVISTDGRIIANRAGYLDASGFLGWLGPIVPER